MRNPATPQFSELANTASQHANRITLSILVPFYRDDPTALAAALNPLIGVRRDIEIVLLDDGCPDLGLNEAVGRAVRALSAPARLISAAENIGRSAGRNLLARQARGRWLLYLDADMDPGNDAFLAAYLERLELDDFDAAFGGYETDEPDDRRYQLHAVLARTSDQKDAAARSLIGATAFCRPPNPCCRNSVMAPSIMPVCSRNTRIWPACPAPGWRAHSAPFPARACCAACGRRWPTARRRRCGCGRRR